MPQPRSTAAPRVARVRLSLAFAGLCGLGAAVMIVLAIQHSALQYRDRVHVATRNAENLSRTLAEHIGQATAQVDQVLSGVAETIIALSEEQRGVQGHAVLRRRVAALAHVRSIFVLDADGRRTLTSRSPTPEMLNFSDRDYFIAHATGALAPSSGLHVSETVTSRTDGRVFLPMSRRIEGADGRFAGVVVAAVEPEYFRILFEKLDVGPRGTVALRSGTGALIARAPADPAVIGKVFLDGPLYRELSAGHREKTLPTRSPIDGIDRILSYRTVPNQPLIVSVAVARADFLAAWWHDTLVFGAVTLIFLIVTGALSALLFRKLAEAESAGAQLRESEARFRDFSIAASDWFWELDERLRFTFVSRSRPSSPDARAEHYLGKTVREAYPFEFSEDQWARWEAEIAARRPIKELRVQRVGASGRLRHFAVNGVPVFDKGGRFLGYRGVTRDVTAEVEAAATLRAVIDGLPAIINAKNTRQRYVLMNAHQARLYGTTTELAIGRTAAELLGADYGAHTSEFDRRVIDTGAPSGFYEERYAGVDGIERDWLTAKIPLKDARGTVKLVLTVGTEITALKAAEARLRSAHKELSEAKETAERANRAKSDFLANMSHELRTPLNAIIGFSEVMMTHTFGPLGAARYDEYVGDIHRSGKHLLDLINDVLDMARIEAQKREFNPEPVDCAASIEDAARMFRDRAREAGVTIRTAVPRELPPLMADRRAIRQILLNLASNAVKFTPSGGSVTIGARLDAYMVHLFVEDTGIGIPADQLDQVGTPFFRTGSAITRGAEGTGLGLALTKSLVELHGGTLTVVSELGRGTAVTGSFPTRLMAKAAVGAAA